MIVLTPPFKGDLAMFNVGDARRGVSLLKAVIERAADDVKDGSFTDVCRERCRRQEKFSREVAKTRRNKSRRTCWGGIEDEDRAAEDENDRVSRSASVCRLKRKFKCGIAIICNQNGDQLAG